MESMFVFISISVVYVRGLLQKSAGPERRKLLLLPYDIVIYAACLMNI